MKSTEVCTYLRAVAEAATAKDEGTIWQPGPAPATLKSSSQRRGRTSRAPGDGAGPVAVPVADEGPGEEVASAAEVALAFEAAQAVAVGLPSLIVAFTTINGRWMANK